MLEYRRMTKDQIRKIIRDQRKKQPLVKKQKNDQKIYTTLENLPEFQNAKSVLFFAPIKEEGEINTWELIKKYIQEKKILLPRSDHKNNKLEACQIENIKDIEIARHNIHEPQQHCSIIHPSDIDLVIIPGIAFDKQGNRIGFGKGFYDRFLKKVSCPVVALAYDFQIVQSIPGEEHDVRIDKIITEKKVISCNNS